MAKKSTDTQIDSSTVKEAQWLAGVLEKAFRPMVRALVGRVSVQALSDVLRQLYLDEAARKLEASGEHQTRASLALLSGWDTRTVNDALGQKLAIDPVRAWPQLGILTLWQSDPRYRNRKTGQPKDLKLYGDGPNFFKLVVRAIGRNITPRAVLGKLADNKSIAMIDDGKVRFVSARYKEFKPQERKNLEAAAEKAGAAFNKL